MKKSQIFTRTFTCTMSIMAVLLILLHITIYILFPHFYLKNTKNDLTKKADDLSKILSNSDETSIQNYLKIYNKTANISVSLKAERSEDNSIQIKPENELKIDKTNNNNSVFIEARQIKLKDQSTATLQFISSRNAKKDAENLTINFLPYSLIIGLLFSILFSYFSSKIIVKPILAAEKIASNIERTKTTFLRSASHEFKTPLAGLRITLENMKYNIGEYKNRDKYLDYSISLVDKMSNTISEVLNASSYQEWLGTPSNITLTKELPKIIKEYKPLISQKNLQIDINLKNESLKISRPAFQKLFSNLIGNAIKYSNAHNIIYIYSKNHWLCLKNTCTPIKKQQIPALFNLFSHGEHKQSTGIGLFIVKNILEHYKIKYEFKPTKNGMVFCLKLPK